MKNRTKALEKIIRLADESINWRINAKSKWSWVNDMGTYPDLGIPPATECQRNPEIESAMVYGVGYHMAALLNGRFVGEPMLYSYPVEPRISECVSYVQGVWGRMDEQFKTASLKQIKELEMYGYCQKILDSSIGPSKGLNDYVVSRYDYCYAQWRKDYLCANMRKLDLFIYAAFEETLTNSPLSNTATVRVKDEGWKKTYEEWIKEAGTIV